MYYNHEGYNKMGLFAKKHYLFFEVWSYEIPKLQGTILIMCQKDFGKFEDVTISMQSLGGIIK
jgi:hypothetical protein